MSSGLWFPNYWSPNFFGKSVLCLQISFGSKNIYSRDQMSTGISVWDNICVLRFTIGWVIFCIWAETYLEFLPFACFQAQSESEIDSSYSDTKIAVS